MKKIALLLLVIILSLSLAFSLSACDKLGASSDNDAENSNEKDPAEENGGNTDDEDIEDDNENTDDENGGNTDNEQSGKPEDKPSDNETDNEQGGTENPTPPEDGKVDPDEDENGTTPPETEIDPDGGENKPPEGNEPENPGSGESGGDFDINGSLIPEGYSEGLDYELSADESYYIVTGSGSCEDEHLMIPPEYNGKPVSEIGKNAFMFSFTTRYLTVPGSVKVIREGAFNAATRLEEVYISEGVSTIEYQAFYFCIKLKVVSIPDSINYIGFEAFDSCSALTCSEYDNALYLGNENNPNLVLLKAKSTSITSCELAPTTKIILSEAFKSCSSLTELKLNEGLAVIGDNVFTRCTALSSVAFPDSVTTIGEYLFYECYNLENVTLGDGITYIGDFAFASCDKLVYNVYDNGYYIGTKNNPYFVYVKLKSSSDYANIHSETRVIGSNAFVHFPKMETLYIPENVTYIAYKAIGICKSLKTIEVDERNKNYVSVNGDIYTVDGELLRYASGKTEEVFTAPAFVTSIADAAFSDSDNIKNVVIGKDVISIPNDAFANCKNLASITIADENPVYKTVDGILYSKDGTHLIKCPMGKSQELVRIPDGVLYIDDYAFEGCSGFTSLVLPASVAEVGFYSFNKCNFSTLYYMGTADGFSMINVDFLGNGAFENKPRYYYSDEVPVVEGMFWHYGANGEIIIWENPTQET